VVRVTSGSNKRVSLAALIAVRPGCRPRLRSLADLGGVHDFRSFALLITAHSASSKTSG
jgi:hypothetical protein